LNACAEQHNARLTSVGILPTLTAPHLGPQVITPLARYQALSAQLRRLHNEQPFEIQLNGPDPLTYSAKDVSPEGANTSFQFHYRCPAQTSGNHYNAAQLITPLVLALSGNSPFFLGHRLWHETRVGLFKQSVDVRIPAQRHVRHPARVAYGHGWVRQNVYELFAESVALYPPLLPVCDELSPAKASPSSHGTQHAPSLQALRLHHGCIWPWNRAIYDPADQGHIRLELRTLPAGPTAVDMLANAALSVGLIEGIQPQLADLLCSMPFKLVEQNFYRAAQSGLNATLLWPGFSAQYPLAPPTAMTVTELLQQLLPVAREGLAKIGIGTMEIDRYLQIITARCKTQQTGALWQLNRYEALRKKQDHTPALCQLVEDYYEHSCQNIPVHQWPV
jgi:hypothetical protein